MRLILKETPSEWRKFTLQFCVVIFLGGALLTWRQVIAPTTLIGLLAVLGCIAGLAVARPGWFRGFYRFGMIASAWLGERVGPIVLVVFFFLFVLPLGWILRLTGHDPLALKRPRDAKSYWRPAGGGGRLDQMY
jgi:hypothetical protein